MLKRNVRENPQEYEKTLSGKRTSVSRSKWEKEVSRSFDSWYVRFGQHPPLIRKELIKEGQEQKEESKVVTHETTGMSRVKDPAKRFGKIIRRV